MKKFIPIAILIAGLGACSDPPTAERVLNRNGYTQIKITGYSVFMCGKEDAFATGFEATAPGGQRVSGAVCSGLFKGATIRFE